jgi:uncharacterized protein YueI
MIKLIDILKEALTDETRLRGDWHKETPPKLGKLYHGTFYERMLKILKDNFVLKSRTSISFSRSKRFWPQAEVRIIVDGKKLAQKYDVEPYDWGGEENESEEQIVGVDEADISDCIIKVLLKPEEAQSKGNYLLKIIKSLKEKNIPYEITDNFPAAS